MDQPESSAEIPLSTTRRESHLEPKIETETPSHSIDKALGAGTVEQDSKDGAPSKKLLAFKLAFIGLAAAVFVFQMDATSLGIALPVSPLNSSLLPPLACFLGFYFFLLSTVLFRRFEFLVALVPYFFLSGRSLLWP